MKSKNSSYINFPAVIQNLITRIDYLVHSRMKYGRSGIYKAMRPERSNSLVILLTDLSKKAVLGMDGVFCKVIDGVAYPLTVEDMSRISGLSVRNVQRCLHDLADMKYLVSSRQIKRTGKDGNLEVGPVLRRFTEKFWRDAGLYSAFVEAVKYATQNFRLKIAWTFKSIVKATKAISGALSGNSTDKVPKDKERQRKNAAFFEYLDCSKYHAPGCLGGYASAAACALCRKLRGGKAGK